MGEQRRYRLGAIGRTVSILGGVPPEGEDVVGGGSTQHDSGIHGDTLFLELSGSDSVQLLEGSSNQHSRSNDSLMRA